MIFRPLLLIFFSTVLLPAGTIRIALAANVSYAINDLIHAFNATHPDTKVQAILGGTGKLVAQIRFGATYEIFMAANMAYPNALYRDGLCVAAPKVYARGSLALLSSKSRDLSKGLSLLQQSNIHKIAIANPKTAPYGKASFEALKSANMLEKLKPKFVYGESISQTVTYATTAADIGLVAKSSLYSPQMSRYTEGEHWSSIDSTLYTPIDQGIVILKTAKHNPEAQAFYDFILSSDSRGIFRRYGYQLP